MSGPLTGTVDQATGSRQLGRCAARQGRSSRAVRTPDAGAQVASAEIRIRREAADLLACLASQPDGWWPPWTIEGLTGRWSPAARCIAQQSSYRVHLSERRAFRADLDWRERYAEAEARLREASRGG